MPERDLSGLSTGAREHARPQVHGESGPHPFALARLKEALRRARDASSSSRPSVCGELNLLLGTLPGPHRAPWYECLLGLLEARAFDGLVDEHGVSCGERAVAALLDAGYPWALHVAPEDLARFRGTPPPPASMATRVAVVLSGAITGVTAVLVLLWLLGA